MPYRGGAFGTPQLGEVIAGTKEGANTLNRDP